MTFYELALFVHVVTAIALVGGSASAHLSMHLLRRSRTVDAADAHVGWLQVFARATGPIAGVVLLAGLYLAFAGDWWGAGWPVVSLVLFAFGGIAAATVVDPSVKRMRARLDELGVPRPGAVPPTDLVEARLRRVTWALFGADLAIVLLMTAKPGWGTSLVVAAVGLAVGFALGERSLRAERSAAAAPPSAPPAAPAV